MARKEIYTCDHCGAEIDDENGYIDLEIIGLSFVCNVDLCKKCNDELDEKVREFCKIGKE